MRCSRCQFPALLIGALCAVCFSIALHEPFDQGQSRHQVVERYVHPMPWLDLDHEGPAGSSAVATGPSLSSFFRST